MTDAREESLKVFQIFVEDLSRVNKSESGFSIPVIEHSGLNLCIHMNHEQAHRLMLDLQMSIVSWIAHQGPQIVKMPKSPLLVEAREWKLGSIREKNSIVVKIEGENHSSVDVILNKDGAFRMAKELIEFVRNKSYFEGEDNFAI